MVILIEARLTYYSTEDRKVLCYYGLAAFALMVAELLTAAGRSIEV